MKASAIILTTYHTHEDLIDECIAVLKHFWPKHPPIVVISDKGNFTYKDRIIIDSPHWTEVLSQAMTQAVQKYQYFRDDDYVLLLLEDHIPLSPLPLNKISKALDYAANEKMSYLGLFGHGKGECMHSDNQVVLYQRKPDYRFYTEVHPAFWKAGYLQKIAQHSVEHNRLSAWDFETQKGLQPHYTTDQLWTSKLGGFLVDGQVDRKALKEMDSAELLNLRKKLQKKAMRALPKRAFKRMFS